MLGVMLQSAPASWRALCTPAQRVSTTSRSRKRKYLIQSKADMFSMGCVLYELLTDQHAFVRPSDGNVWDLTFEELLKVVLLRQRQWVSSFSATGVVRA